MRLALLTSLALMALNRPGPAIAGSPDSLGEPLLLPHCQGNESAISFEELRRHASRDHVVVRGRLFRSQFCTRSSDCSAPLALRSLGQPPPPEPSPEQQNPVPFETGVASENHGSGGLQHDFPDTWLGIDLEVNRYGQEAG
jgi:hypothetical protein